MLPLQLRQIRPVFCSTLILSVLLVGCAKSSSSHPDSNPLTRPEAKSSEPAPAKPAEAPYDGHAGGFFKVGADGLPSFLTPASRSVFEIWVPLRQRAVIREFGLMGALSKKQEILNSNRLEKEKAVVIAQLEACEREAGWKSWFGFACEFSEGFARGTAFVIDDGSTLWTSYTVTKGGIHFLDNLKEGTPTPFFLFDSAGNLVFDSTKEPALPVRFHKNAALKYFTQIYVPNTDFISYQLPRALAPGLPVTAEMPENDQRVFALAFTEPTGLPVKSFDRDLWDRDPQPNADGSLLVNIGRLTDTPTIDRIRPLNQAEAEWYGSDPLKFAEMDGCAAGFGAPVFNERGEVFALRSYYHNASDDLKTEHLSVLVRLPQ